MKVSTPPRRPRHFIDHGLRAGLRDVPGIRVEQIPPVVEARLLTDLRDKGRAIDAPQRSYRAILDVPDIGADLFDIPARPGSAKMPPDKRHEVVREGLVEADSHPRISVEIARRSNGAQPG